MDAQRFWSKVRVVEDACWEWQAFRKANGYGTIRLNHPRRKEYAHRVSWALHNGPIPRGMMVCHRCDNPPCVRPDHLFLGTGADNQQDKVRKGRQNGGARSGELNHNARFTAAEVANIRAMAASGVSRKNIALWMKCSRGAVQHIVSGRSW